uniref:Oxygenase n=1 Tax=uncultured organism TaxID=155900 RepID=Q108L2_9ZZZZ|nr:oxygenase [uncultured organism]
MTHATLQSNTTTERWQQQLLPTFGMLVHAREAGTPLSSLPADTLRAWAEAESLVILRGFAPPEGDALPSYCRGLGDLLEWDFGAINNLQAQSEAKNYLFTNRAVPFHWDGAFVGRIPHWIFFHCASAPEENTGGETLFCHTPLLLEAVSAAGRAQWENISIRYSTEKLAHYGGSFTSPLLAAHPIHGQTILRYAEPVNDLNPVHLEIQGLPEESHTAFLEGMHTRLYDPAVCYAHAWQTGDIVIADNFTLLHGRRAFLRPESRHLRRVNIL